MEALAPLGDLEGLGDIWAGLGERLRFIFYDFITKILQNEVTLTKTRIFCLRFFSHLFFFFAEVDDGATATKTERAGCSFQPI